ncbi:MAG: LCP family protein [Candidatus Moranbacteria bacterium]|nr:LCP family protein [Candidatus Moranbacteria bacterium]
MYKGKKTMRYLAAILILLLVAGSLFLGWRLIRTAEKIHVENASSEGVFGNLSSVFPGADRERLAGEERNGRVNILLLGRAGKNYPGQNLTDTIILASIDVREHRAAFLSIPRDLFVPIPDSGLSTKLNSVYQYGLSSGKDADLVIRTVENITGQDIPFYIALDFDGFEKILDDIGGIRVYSERDILDTRYPGKNYSYETFSLSAGWHTLDGATALKYARERHDDPEGDFGRAKRQQQIIKAFQEKALSLRTYIDPFTVNRLLGTLGDSVRTNLSMSQIGSLLELGKTTDLRNASTIVIDAWKKESLLRVSHLEMNGVRAFILVPRTGNWNEVRDIASNIFDKQELDRKRDGMEREKASILILSRPEDTSVANRFAAALKDAVPAEDIRVSTDNAGKLSQMSTVFDRTNLGKPFTLDSLLGTFSLQKTVYTPSLPAGTGDADFVIVIGNDVKERPLPETSLGSETDTDVAEDSFSEYFEPQAR